MHNNSERIIDIRLRRIQIADFLARNNINIHTSYNLPKHETLQSHKALNECVHATPFFSYSAITVLQTIYCIVHVIRVGTRKK